VHRRVVARRPRTQPGVDVIGLRQELRVPALPSTGVCVIQKFSSATIS
jgi:hypothetical protein